MNKSKLVDTLTIAIIGLLAFGLQVPFLGFFQDDWNFVFYSSTRGVQGIFDFLILDGRPGASWVYILGFRLLQYHPFAWQLLTIVLRIATAICFWQILNKFWENRRYGNLVLAILFLVYPFFTLQPLSVAYAPHFAAYLAYMASIYLMLRAVESPGSYVKYSIPAVILTFVHLFTVEYFIGLEVLRPFLLWFLPILKRETSHKRQLYKVLMNWFPYAVATFSFILWRTLFISNLVNRNNLLASNSDLTKIFSVFKNMPADFVLMLVNSWATLVDPEKFVIGPARNLYLLVFSLAAGVFYYFIARQASKENYTEVKFGFGLLTGSAMVILGMIATYAVGYIVHLKIPPWNSRFALPALPGLSIIIVVIVESLVHSPHKRHVLWAILIGLLIGSHNQNTFNFKTAWEKQERLYQQLIWRAPSIKPGTAIIAEEEIVGYMGDYPLSFALNTVYEAESGYNSSYWFYAISENFNFNIDKLLNRDELKTKRAATLFRGLTSDVIFITYEPEKDQCLWVLRPETAEYKYLSTNMKRAALVSNINRINPDGKSLSVIDQIVDEDTNNWCYYYQKAELARQTANWQTAISLWNEAKSRGLRPRNGFEMIPFVESYANLEKWENAYLLTDEANSLTDGMYLLLCPTWQSMANNNSSSPQKDLFVDKANQLLGCVVPRNQN